MRSSLAAALSLAALLPAARADTAPVSTTMRVVRDVAYLGSATRDPRRQTLDLYAPAASGPHPVVVFVHGGGWRMGDKGYAGPGREKGSWFTDEGFLYVSLNYRLSPAVQHPAHIEDVAAGIAWVASHVTRHGGDPRRVVVMGHSAGAHLAALVAVDPRHLGAHGLGLDALAGVVLLDGAGYDIAAELEGGPRPVRREMFTSAFGQDPAGWRDASPTLQVAPGRGTPPFLILHVARRAESRRASQDLAAALRAAGAEATVVAVAGKNHGTISGDLGRPGDPVTGAVREFLRARTGR